MQISLTFWVMIKVFATRWSSTTNKGGCGIVNMKKDQGIYDRKVKVQQQNAEINKLQLHIREGLRTSDTVGCGHHDAIESS